jgi:hypothetical protein
VGVVRSGAVDRRPHRPADRAALLRDRRTHPRPRVVSQRSQSRAAQGRTRRWRAPTVRPAPTTSRARRRAAPRRHPAPADPPPAGALIPVYDGDVPARDRFRGDHLRRSCAAGSDDARQRRARALSSTPLGSAGALTRSRRSGAGRATTARPPSRTVRRPSRRSCSSSNSGLPAQGPSALLLRPGR